MPKYVVEGDISFYDELYKSLDEKQIQENQSDEVDLCLITNAPLKENYVTLGCNHKFNYDAIYNDIYCHKKKYNNMERCAVKQKEIRCPYCRTINKGLLPYVDGYQKVHGVNHYNEAEELSQVYKNNINTLEYLKGSCCYLPPTSNPTDDILNLPPKCYNCYVKLFQIDEKYYCGLHLRVRMKEIYNANKLKEKNDKKMAIALEKQKIKDEKIKSKLEEKMKKQAEKMLAKTNKIKNENVIISSSQQSGSSEIDETKCVQILKSGPNKGKQCGCKIVNQGLCGRHNKGQIIADSK
jgi:hypothetical protein